MASTVMPAIWRRQRFSCRPRGDLSAIRHHLRCEILEVLGWFDGALEGPVLAISMPPWRTIDDPARLPDELDGLVAELEVLKQGIVGQEVPEDLVGRRATRTTLMNQCHQMAPCHSVELEETCDVLPQLEGLAVGASLDDWPEVRGVLEDLGAKFPLEVRVTRVTDLLEHPQACLGLALEVLVIAPTIILRFWTTRSLTPATHALASCSRRATHGCWRVSMEGGNLVISHSRTLSQNVIKASLGFEELQIASRCLDIEAILQCIVAHDNIEALENVL